MDAQVYRTNSSSYQSGSFFKDEKEALESLPGVTYLQSLSEVKKGRPFILISNTHTSPSELPPELLKNTVLWIHPNSGYDNFSREFVAKAGFPIILGNPIRAAAVTEYILGCVFKRFAPVPNHTHWSTDRKWDRSLLRDQKVLIIGAGLIGKTLHQCLSPLCSQLITVDPYLDRESAKKSQIKAKLSDEDLEGAGVVLVASSLSPTSNGMLNKNFFSRLSADCLIVNAARGEIIIEDDLVAWLRKNPKAMAYLDVFQEEPFAPGHLSQAKNINKTSHIAGVHRGLNQGIIEYEKMVISDFLAAAKDNDLKSFKEAYKEFLLTEDSPSFL